MDRPKGAHCDIGAYESENVSYPVYIPLVSKK
jgi:hypothetical protein